MGSFLSKGAIFNLVSIDDLSVSVVLKNHSALYQILKELPASVTLSEDLACTEDECNVGEVSRVRVGVAVYQYNPPPCVYLHYDVDFIGEQGLLDPIGEAGTLCADGTLISSYDDCLEAIKSLGLNVANPWVENSNNIPPSCSYNGKMHYNEGAVGSPRADLQPICSSQFTIEVDEHGYIIDGGAKFSVSWADGMAAPPGSHPVGARENSVFVIGGNTSFTNPPVFLKSSTQVNAEAAVLNEVSTFLDRLFHHDNTPVFIVKRLIQRFTSSNPSGGYVQAVAEAFRTGSFNGTVYGGKYGDLAATFAAVVLHSDAQQTGIYGGALREPLLKILHLMRSMEYEDSVASPVMFRDLQDVIGQFPFNAPSVFDYYKADYEIPIPRESESEAALESDGAPSLILGPEFEIFTPKYFVGYLNIMTAIISWGVSGDCDGKNTFAGLSGDVLLDERTHQLCPKGRLTWNSRQTEESVLDDLNLLLTGGRLSQASLDTVREAYEHAVIGQNVKSALRAVIMTPEFNTLGESVITSERAEENPPVLNEITPSVQGFSVCLDGRRCGHVEHAGTSGV